ncbi:MAG: hypothetical protein ACFFDN_04070 [Candidatus Hodarchaeota archaeon]
MSYFFIYFSLIIIVIILSSLNIAYYYYFKLYKLTQYSNVWRSFKKITIGMAGVIIGMIVMLLMLFHYLLTTFPDLFVDAYFNITNFYALAVILGSSVCITGVIIDIYGTRKFYQKMEKMVVESSES